MSQHPATRWRRAALAATLAAGAAVLHSSPTAAEAAGGSTGTALPVGWELCVLAGLQAPATSQNVSDLAAWQVAEGGSTKNANAYNPFNTKRTTAADGAALPLQMTAAGFPAFATWSAGCSATVATVEQPNMTPILTILRQSSAPSPAAFLVVVDATAWCAPSQGMPCYTGLITAGGIDVEDMAISVYHDATQALEGYEQAMNRVATDQATLDAEAPQLRSITAAVDNAQRAVVGARSALAGLAISEYEASPATNADPNLQDFASQRVSSVLATYYDGLDATRQVGIYKAALSVLDAQQASEDHEQAQIQASAGALVADQTAAAGALAALEVRLASLQAAGVCLGIAPLAASTTELDTCLGSLAPPSQQALHS